MGIVDIIIVLVCILGILGFIYAIAPCKKHYISECFFIIRPNLVYLTLFLKHLPIKAIHMEYNKLSDEHRLNKRKRAELIKKDMHKALANLNGEFTYITTTNNIFGKRIMQQHNKTLFVIKSEEITKGFWYWFLCKVAYKRLSGNKKPKSLYTIAFKKIT